MLTGCCYSQSDNLVCPPFIYARFTPDFGYCHSISTDIFPLFCDSSGFSKLRSSFRQLKYQLFPSLHHCFILFLASATHVSHVSPDRWCSLWLSMNILSQGYLFTGCLPYPPFLSVASVTSTYDLDFLKPLLLGKLDVVTQTNNTLDVLEPNYRTEQYR